MNNSNLDAESGLVSLGESNNIIDLSESQTNSEIESPQSSSQFSSLPSVNNHLNPSILPPLLIKDARTTSYLVGTVGSHVNSLKQNIFNPKIIIFQDFLLGTDELYKYFPDGKLKILIISWNMSSNPASGNINDLLLPEDLMYVPDLYAIGVQEASGTSSSQIKEWEVKLQTTLGPNHVLLHSCSLGVLHLAIFLRRDLIWFCTVPEDGSFNSRPSATNQHKTKGAVAVSFAFFGTTFLFINSHLPAHEGRIKERIEEYEKICNSINLPKNLLPLKPRYISKDVTARFDCVFWFGDLNFRIESSFREVISLLNELDKTSNPSMECLLKDDQLIRTMELGNAFHGFNEPPIYFPPTFKFRIGSNDFDSITQRVPSYTDRILNRSKRPGHIIPIKYNSVRNLITSDHKPVYSFAEVQLRPGRDNALIMNAGNFNRDIYIEALKRRANEINDEFQRISLICSIS